MTARSLLVAETFGPTYQGEGATAGRQAMFVRLSRCNLHCPSCDTPYTWDWTRFDPAAEASRLELDEVLARVLEVRTEIVVITGGEPLLQRTAVTELATRLAAAGRRVEIETNGTVPPTDALVAAVSSFNVSPKLPTFAAARDRPIRPAALRALMASGKAMFKFVVTEPADLDRVGTLVAEHRLHPVWIMPAAVSSAQLVAGLRAVSEQTLQRGWNLSGRLHLLLWEDTRGR